MKQYRRRYDRWYELVIYNHVFQLVVGMAFVIYLPAMLLWGPQWWSHASDSQIGGALAVGLAFIVAVFFLQRIERFTGGAWVHIAPVVTGAFLLAFAVVLFTRMSYSRGLLLQGYVATMVWFYGGMVLTRRLRRHKYAVVPMAQGAERLVSTQRFEFRHISEPDLGTTRFDGVIADLRSGELSPQWERFLTECILSHIPVFDVRLIAEHVSGRVQIEHLSENAAGALMPSLTYMLLKRIFDVIGVILTAPITIALGLLTAVAIRIDSPGSALFVQERVGLGNRDFKIYKFRSMYESYTKKGSTPRSDSNEDNRITRVGKFIRKTRLDELPQLINVLKGDMSLIGPRPEWRALAQKYAQVVPFYNYRHVVRPGITGWAQVTQGYAWDEDDTHIKIQHDFYYIKHFSFWLDVLITFKTMRVLFTGHGAR